MRHLLKCNYYSLFSTRTSLQIYTAKNQILLRNAGFMINPPKLGIVSIVDTNKAQLYAGRRAGNGAGNTKF